MDERQLAAQLTSEGYRHTYVWQEQPNEKYPNRTHPIEIVQIILNGEMTVTLSGRSQTYRPGDRCAVPAKAVHSVRIGPQGCRYLVGER